MIKNSKRGSHTIEAVLILPLIILAVLSLGYIMRADSMWENCFFSATDECAKHSSTGVASSGYMIESTLKNRILSQKNHPDSIEISHVASGYSDGLSDNLTSFTTTARLHMSLPVGFDRNLVYTGKLKYRCFCGNKYNRKSMGSEGLETYEAENPVWIFPRSGQKYHKETCTYVKATVHSEVLTPSLKRKYSACGLCNSQDLSPGSIVFVFQSENSAYHRGSCPTIKRHTMVMDKSDAVKRGYTPCSKCGGSAN